MKKWYFLSVFLLGFTLTSFAQQPKKDTLVVNTKIYCDHCLKCGSCAGKINLSLKSFPGIKNIDIQPEENKITVVYNPRKTDPEKIRNTIAKAGFDADEVKAKPEDVEALDACCKPR